MSNPYHFENIKGSISPAMKYWDFSKEQKQRLLKKSKRHLSVNFTWGVRELEQSRFIDNYSTPKSSSDFASDIWKASQLLKWNKFMFPSQAISQSHITSE